MSSELGNDLNHAATFTEPGPGVTRLAWTEPLEAANRWLAQRMEDAGLEVEIDAAGNVVGKWNAGRLPAVVIGSHLDTVRQGGRYDGALGVLAGLEAIRRLRREGFVPEHQIWLVSFMDEEGARFGGGMLGSLAFCGEPLDFLHKAKDSDGITLPDAMRAAGRDFGSVEIARAVKSVGAYVELHIEQGPALLAADAEIGVVTDVAGLVVLRVRLSGQSNHAGTTPMAHRRDPLLVFARSLLALHERANQPDADFVATVGMVSVQPGTTNTIPGVCEFSVDIRSPHTNALRGAVAFARETFADFARRGGAEVEIEELDRVEPVALSADLVTVVEAAAAAEEAPSMRLHSGAAHDAMVLARHVPTALFFVPSQGGVSHSPDEYTEQRHCDLGARILARVVASLPCPPRAEMSISDAERRSST